MTPNQICEIAENMPNQPWGSGSRRIDAIKFAEKLLESSNSIYREALTRISMIENKENGPDWEEIEEAREIADQALGVEKPRKFEWVGDYDLFRCFDEDTGLLLGTVQRQHGNLWNLTVSNGVLSGTYRDYKSAADALERMVM